MAKLFHYFALFTYLLKVRARRSDDYFPFNIIIGYKYKFV